MADETVVVGSPKNRATCTLSQSHGYGLGPELLQALALNLPEGTNFDDPTALCLHELYGGKKNLNFGGVCLHSHNIFTSAKPIREIKLAFPYLYRSPEYSGIMPTGKPNVAGAHSAALAFVEAYCRTRCQCDDQQEEDIEMAKTELVSAASQMMRWGGPQSHAIDLSESSLNSGLLSTSDGSWHGMSRYPIDQTAISRDILLMIELQGPSWTEERAVANPVKRIANVAQGVSAQYPKQLTLLTSIGPMNFQLCVQWSLGLTRQVVVRESIRSIVDLLEKWKPGTSSGVLAILPTSAPRAVPVLTDSYGRHQNLRLESWGD